MKKQLTIEDFTMIFQWVVALLLAPFVLLPLFPRQQVDFAVRLLVVVGALMGSGIMTLIYLRARGKSRRAAAQVANLTAFLDVCLVFAALLFWPRHIPDLFWILPIMVIVVATRFGYRETAIVAVLLAALYGVTIVARIGTAPLQTVIGDTLIRIVLMLAAALAAVFITQKEKMQRRDARILGRVAAAIGSTLDADELMKTVVEGISEAAGLGRCTAFLISGDGRWATLHSTTEKDEGVREQLFSRRIDLGHENIAKEAIRTRDVVIVTEPESSPLFDRKWVEDFDIGAILVLPIVLHDEPKGIVFVERKGRKKQFSDREVEICKTILSQSAAGLENAIRYAEEQKKRSEADVMYRTSRELTSSLELEEVLENACQIAVRNLYCSACTAFVLDDSGSTLTPRVSVGKGGVKRTVFPSESGIVANDIEGIYNLAQRPPAMTLSRPEESSVLPRFLKSEGPALMAPFYSHGSLVGLLMVTGEQGREFTDEQITRLAVTANETALAVVNARLHEKIKTDAAQMASLVQLANAIGSTADLPTIVRLALETVRHLFDCDSGLVYQVDEDDRCLRYVDSFGFSRQELEKASSGPCPVVDDCRAFVEERLIGIDDLSRASLPCNRLGRSEHGSAICVGMRAEGKTLGILHAWSESQSAFSEEDQQLVLAIADQIALALQRALLFEEIKRLAITDPLTGVFNVRRLGDVLQDEVSRARRYKRPVSFLMVDVDNLKSYNDTLGHPKGDVTLSQIASIIDSGTRDVDKVFRYGGDEFCVVLPETDMTDAIIVAEKLRDAVSDFHFPDEEKVPTGRITISVGVASLPRDADDEQELVNQADLALYSAKQSGRNSVAVAETPEDLGASEELDDRRDSGG